MVSAALMAQQELEETESEQGPAGPDEDQDREEHDSRGNPKDTTRNKMV